MEAGAYLSVEDYATLLWMHLRGGLCGDTRVLSKDAVARMQVDRIKEAYDGTTIFLGQPSERFPGYGLGWWIAIDRWESSATPAPSVRRCGSTAHAATPSSS